MREQDYTRLYSDQLKAKIQAGYRPSATLAIVSYNQEKYIRDAVLAALAQTYEPLEIIFSDDCSRDATFDIIKELVQSYSGPHKIVLRQNAKNLGVTKHFNEVMRIAKGDMYVCGAGDDVALPNRVQVIMEKWAQLEYCPMTFYTQMYWMEEDGSSQKELVCRQRPSLIDRSPLLKANLCSMPGASGGWSRSVYEMFGDLDPEYSSSEDGAYAVRGAMLDRLVFIDTPTIYWRKSGLWTGMQGKPEYEKKIRYDGLTRPSRCAMQMLCDALRLHDEDMIKASMAVVSETLFSRDLTCSAFVHQPVLFVRAWLSGAKLGHLMRWTYRAVRYRWRFVWKDRILFRKRNWAYMGDREIEYEQRVQSK